MQSVTNPECKPVPALPPAMWSSHSCPERRYFLVLPMRHAGDLYVLPIKNLNIGQGIRKTPASKPEDGSCRFK